MQALDYAKASPGNHMAAQNPREAANFLDLHANDADDRTYYEFVLKSFGSDPAIAVNHIAGIRNESERDDM
jgi:hypothetical protein